MTTMENLKPEPSLRDRIAPWIEGILLAIMVMVVYSLGGDAVRTSYHGYLHTGLGEAVLRDGLMPENPYHAGTPLHYYTLYPALGTFLGHLGPGSLWGFALLNIFAAMLMGPALDALGKRFHLDFTARRCAFFAMLLGFNGLAYWWTLGVESLPEGALPLVVLLDLTRPLESLQWDGRLQAFLPKFLNVSSFALSLPFALFAMADNLAEGKKELLRCGILLGVTMAINPLVGGFTAILIAVEKMPLLKGGKEAVLRLVPAVVAALVVSVPFLLPLFAGTPEGDASMTGQFPFVGSGAWANLLGPLILMWILGLLGLRILPASTRRPMHYALVLASLFSFLSLPWNNEYKFPRMAAILLALPAGAMLGRLWQGGFGKIGVLALGALCVPTLSMTLSAYAAWDSGSSLIMTEVEAGRLTIREEAKLATWPNALAAAEKALPADAVLLFHPRHPGIAGSGMGAQGNPLMAMLDHPVYVDNPQIHNTSLPDLRLRLDQATAFWEGHVWVRKVKPDTPAFDPLEALMAIRTTIAPRPLAVVSLRFHVESERRLSEAGAELRAEENGVALWLLPPLQEVAGN